MANTTLRDLTALSGTTADNSDLFLVHDYSANTEYKISLAELRTAVGNVGSGALTISSSGTSDALIVSSSDSGAADAPDVVFYRNSATPVNGDIMGNIVFRGKNAALANISYSTISSSISATTAASESGTILFSTMYNGILSEKMRIRFDGNIGLGSVGSLFASILIAKPMTGATTAYGINITSTVNNDVTSNATVFRSAPSTIAAATPYTIATMRHFEVAAMTIGANSSITNQTGFYSAGLTAGNNNYQFHAASTTASSVTTGKFVAGFYSDNPTATGGGASWNLFVAGTASNYINGVLTLGTTSPNAAAKLQIDSTTQGFLPPRMTTTQRNAISSPPAGLTVYNSTTNKLNFYNGTAWEAVTSA